jgi:quercetin dioxygenase-like cupin family protein
MPTSTAPRLAATTSTVPLATQLLGDIAAGIAHASGVWEDLVCHDPTRRRPVRLVATEAYEVWVIGWTQGQQVRPHDHGGSTAAVLVVEGELSEITLLGNRKRLVPGQVHLLGPRVVHDVVNRTDNPATSIHVYSPPLSTMTYYDEQTWEPVETETIRSEAPVLSSWHGAKLLHPARPDLAPVHATRRIA